MNDKTTTGADEQRSDVESTWTVQLLVNDTANATALECLLENRYDVRTGEADLTGDLYLVDDRSFPDYQDRLEALKRDADPAFLPVVLIRRPETRLDLAELDGPSDETHPLVDEVIEAPVRREILFRRLRNLFVRLEQFRMLAEQNERLDEFASVLSHELRNPLQIANGRLSLLAESVPETELDQLEAIKESLDRMDALIETELTVAREGTVTEMVAEADLPTVVEEAWAIIGSETATLVEPDDGATILADRNQLLTLFENLFRNAVEHGGQSVTVSVQAHDRGFAVADDGPGIPPSERDAVLERGYTTGGDGAGLGLDIVLDIVDAHEWELTIDEGDRGGARFVVETE